MKAILTKALFMLIILNTATVSAFAQGHTIQKPVRQQSTTPTTTTTTTQQKPRTRTQTNTSSHSNNSSTTTSTSSQSSSSSAISSTTPAPKPTTGSINGHEWVDLGLSVKWATCNVGANSPSDYGNYYAWGETSTKSEYTEENSKTYGKSMDNIAGISIYDVARANWGGTWRMPTKSEMEELRECRWERTTQEGHHGYKVTGLNGNTIFLPFSGWRYKKTLTNAGVHSLYWSATPQEYNTNSAYALSGAYFSVDCRNRFDGGTVRPVSD